MILLLDPLPFATSLQSVDNVRKGGELMELGIPGQKMATMRKMLTWAESQKTRIE